MARPIKETPILFGKDAIRFLNSKPKPISKEDRKIMFENYNFIKSISKF